MNDRSIEVERPTRREFLAASGGLAAAAAWPARPGSSRPPAAQEAPPSPAVEGTVDEGTLAEAEKLAAVRFTAAERAQALVDLDEQVDRFRRRRVVALENSTAPALVFDPRRGAPAPPPAAGRHERIPMKLPGREEDIVFAPVAALSAWVRRGEISSERLTRLYLDRLRRHGPKLECVVALTEVRALSRACEADREIAAGRWRGPLHGIPWGAKDLFDTAGIGTTWGAEPYRDRVPDRDAAVVARLDRAGAVLVAKLTLGALAYGDIWFGGKTRNPWKIDQGSSGSSAGSAAAVAAGLVGFALGTETYGSIVLPCMRCGATGLRPTFGRVARTGAMALCWSLDKIGPIGRTVEDCALVLEAINGADPGDPSSVEVPFAMGGGRPADGVRLGYDPAWFREKGADDLDRAALETARRAGFQLVEIHLPDWPYDALMTILLVEAASAFEEITLTDRDDELSWQEPQAWPNTFRQSRFIPAIEYVQAQRFRRRVMEMMGEIFAGVDALVSPSFAGSLLLVTNNTGHPSLTLRCGFREDGTPRGITLWGRLFDEATLCAIGMTLERELAVWDRRPAL